LLITIGAAATLLGGILGALAVRRSLRPLREIESTAAAIASGQLGSRVSVAEEHTEVGHLASSLNAMLGRLELAVAAREASEERRRRFVSDGSHELRTPLATVRGYAELYRMGAVTDPEEVAATMRRIEESAARMGLLVEDLLALARLDEAALTQARTEVDLAALARDAAQDLGALDPSREVTVVGLEGGGPGDVAAVGPDGGGPGDVAAVGPDGGGPGDVAAVGPDGGAPGEVLVVGDPARLRQVLTNLVGNVAAHTPAGSPCEVAVGRARDDAVLEVRDRGPGITAEHAERIFERFYRADGSRGRGTGGGAGLGLAIVSSIVTAHRGHVEAHAREEGGTVFRVRLPAVD